MKGFKTFDFFQKVTHDGLNQPTLIGSLFSISAISLMLYLLVREIVNFYTPHITKDTIVVQDEKPDEMIKLELSLDFANLPCNLVSLDQEDSIGNHYFDKSDTILKKRVTPQGVSVNFRNQGQNANMLYTALENKDTCSLVGNLDISKVPGSFHISFHNYRPLFSQLKREKPELAKNINLNHQIKYMYFGKMNVRKMKKFGLELRSFTHKHELPNFMDRKENMDFVYFLKVIPYELVDENWGSVEHFYQYSLSTKLSPFDGTNDDMPIIYMKYEFSPVTMRVTLKRRDYLHFLTHVCAIIGGIFVVFSILNKFMVGLFDSDKN